VNESLWNQKASASGLGFRLESEAIGLVAIVTLSHEARNIDGVLSQLRVCCQPFSIPIHLRARAGHKRVSGRRT
jgi:hypothetical protein